MIKFLWTTKTIIHYLFIPLSWIYNLFFKINFIKRSVTARTIKPVVICIGNIVAGGAGKTPMCISIARHLISHNKTCCFVTKGYGRVSNSDILITKGSAADYNHIQVGDEPLLLSEFADTFVVQDRNNIHSSINDYDYVILDDGLQDPSLKQDIKICVFDKYFDIGNGLNLPIGPMRENISSIKNFDYIVLTGNVSCNQKLMSQLVKYNSNIINTMSLIKVPQEVLNERCIAFSGISNNKKFFMSLKDKGLNLVKKISYPDHYKYTVQDVEKILNFAQKNNCKLITTAKDYVKLLNNDINIKGLIYKIGIKILYDEYDIKKINKILEYDKKY